ncbi:hypothetical protein [Candidatus Odyssella thessalonicensis]|uniref:hypothetical protein n=1 Tax=Candidatus Odyssella thessalonicensis TaxID=84647 RepID=UPI000225A9A6|nr:hypothetical protein [Candidatus Odyssella thessalonicensis]
MKISIFLSSLAFLSIINPVYSNLPSLQDHNQAWRQISEGSWRLQELYPGVITVADFLIDSFGQYPELDRRNIIRFYQDGQDNPVDWMGLLGTPTIDLLATDNARTWQRKLNLREFFRFKDILTQNPNFINDNNFENDDVVKARSLCGTFARRNGIGDYIPAFTGMLVAGQAYLEGQAANNGVYHINTCLHGFLRAQINTIYFVPYGLPLTDDFAFQVQHIYRDQDAQQLITQNQLEAYSQHEDNPYRHPDYSMVTISAHSVGGQTLKQALSHNHIPDFPTRKNDTHLPDLTGFQGNFVLTNDGLNKIFVIGRASEPQAELQENFVVVTNLTTPLPPQPTAAPLRPRRSYKNDPDTDGHPTDVRDLFNSEFTSDYPTYPGMSGGPVLQCRLVSNNEIQRLCRIVGVNWGSERIFDSNNNLINLKSIVSSLQ